MHCWRRLHCREMVLSWNTVFGYCIKYLHSDPEVTVQLLLTMSVFRESLYIIQVHFSYLLQLSWSPTVHTTIHVGHNTDCFNINNRMRWFYHLWCRYTVTFGSLCSYNGTRFSNYSEICLKWNLDITRNLSLAEKFYTMSRVVCKKYCETTFNEEKLRNTETESEEKTLMENIHVFI
jgi:hypothetical protein